jgi:glycosyltransferase involved in cell wall biosynthesis
MNIFLDNVTPGSSTGPNHFGAKLSKYLKRQGHRCYTIPIPASEIQLSFIEAGPNNLDVPIVQRLDGIYFDRTKNHALQNTNILDTYKKANGVIFQSEYSKNLVFKYFGEHSNYEIIHNGADLELMDTVEPANNKELEDYENVWCCASNWRGWKRMPDNIRYFLEFSGKKDCLIVAGLPKPWEIVEHDRIFYAGQVSPLTLFSYMRASKHFIHLARYDACPNVVIDARAAGCHIICCSEGGTKEVAGKGATVVVEEPWDMNPIDVDNPPKLEFNNIVENSIVSDIDMSNVADRYLDYFKTVMEKK